MTDPFHNLPKGHFGAILADPPWRFEVWSGATAVQKRGSKTTYKAAQVHYETMSFDELCALPVADLAAKDCALFMWVTWPAASLMFAPATTPAANGNPSNSPTARRNQWHP